MLHLLHHVRGRQALDEHILFEPVLLVRRASLYAQGMQARAAADRLSHTRRSLLERVRDVGLPCVRHTHRGREDAARAGAQVRVCRRRRSLRATGVADDAHVPAGVDPVVLLPQTHSVHLPFGSPRSTFAKTASHIVDVLVQIHEIRSNLLS
jgi:hypothetical protein